MMAVLVNISLGLTTCSKQLRLVFSFPREKFLTEDETIFFYLLDGTQQRMFEHILDSLGIPGCQYAKIISASIYY